MSTSQSSDSICVSCRRPGAGLTCELCHEAVCKNCRQFLEENTFSFLSHGAKKVPEELSHTYYCSGCYGSTIEPALESYNEMMERAKGVFFFTHLQRKPIPILKRSKDKVQVDICPDRDELILRLGFQAAELGFNAVVEAVLESEKIRLGAYQTTSWRGMGYPAQVDAERLERHSND